MDAPLGRPAPWANSVLRRPWRRWALATLLVCGLAVISQACHSPAPGHGKKRAIRYADVSGVPKARSLAEFPVGLPGEDWDHPLGAPVWREARHADHMMPEDVVLGLSWEGKAWAIPWWIMKNHHVANLTLGSQPVLITFCEVCSSGAAFRPVVGGRRLTYQLAGVYNGSNLVSDLETQSLWAPFSGDALYGPLKGVRVERLPLFQCTWAEWLALHPESVVAFGGLESRAGHGSNQFPGKEFLVKSLRTTLLRPLDPRLRIGELILGVEISGRARAYRLAVLDSMGPVLNDTFGNTEIVILHQPGSLLAGAFSRRVGEDVLQFESRSDGRVVDKASGSVWNLTGEAVRGPRLGQRLTFVFSGIEEWYIWAAYNPKTEIAEAKRPR